MREGRCGGFRRQECRAVGENGCFAQVIHYHAVDQFVAPMKTTILGILTIVASLANAGVQVLKGGSPDVAGTFAGITAGIGLIKAADSAKIKK